jgi:hypothetical protein
MSEEEEPPISKLDPGSPDYWTIMERDHGYPHEAAEYQRNKEANARLRVENERLERERLAELERNKPPSPGRLILTDEERQARLRDRMNSFRSRHASPPRRELSPPPEADVFKDQLAAMRPRKGPPRPASDFHPRLAEFPDILEYLRTHTESPSSEDSPLKGPPPPGPGDSPLKSRRIDFEEEEEPIGGGPPPPGGPEEEEFEEEEEEEEEDKIRPHGEEIRAPARPPPPPPPGSKPVVSTLTYDPPPHRPRIPGAPDFGKLALGAGILFGGYHLGNMFMNRPKRSQ